MTQQLASGEELPILVFSSDDQQLGVRRMDREIRLWNVNPAREYRVLLGRVGPSEQIQTIDFSPEGRWLAAASYDGIVIWDAASGREVVEREEPSTHAAFFDPSSGDLLTSRSLANSDMGAWLRFRLEVEPPATRFVLAKDRNRMPSLPKELGPFALAGNGKVAVVLHSTNEMCVFDPNRSEPTKVISVTNRYQYLAVSPDGQYLAARIAPTNEVSAQASLIHIWDLAKFVRLTSAASFAAGPDFAFSPNGEWFVTTSPNTVQFWRTGTWQLEHRLQFNAFRGPIAFSGDGRLFAMTDCQSAIQLVRLPEGVSLLRLENPDRKRVTGLALSPDGKRLAAISSEQLVLLWDLGLISGELSRLNLEGKSPFNQ
jgi:WD40 repeat protein